MNGSEFCTSIVEPLFEPDDLKLVTAHKDWLRLSPNYPSSTALLPQSLSADQIYEIASCFNESSPLTRIEKSPNRKKPQLELPNGMHISFHDLGESKWCYKLTYKDLYLAIILAGYAPQFPIPKESRFCLVNSTPGKNYYSFSDLRTYLCLPVIIRGSDHRVTSTLSFQEWGGEDTVEDEKNPWIIKARSSVCSYIGSHGYAIIGETMGELAHTRHYLFNQGKDSIPAVIDIPCTK